MSRFSDEVERLLREAGWYPERSVFDLVQAAKTSLESPEGFRLTPSAERILMEFGGLQIEARGSGVDRARASVHFDPSVALGEEDRFFKFYDELRGKSMFPLGELYGGHAFLGVEDNGAIWLVGDIVMWIADSIDEALEKLLLGIR